MYWGCCFRISNSVDRIYFNDRSHPEDSLCKKGLDCGNRHDFGGRETKIFRRILGHISLFVIILCLLKRNSIFSEPGGTDGADAGVADGGAAMEGCEPETEGVEGLCGVISSARKVPLTGDPCSETRGRDVTRSRGAFVRDNVHRYCFSYPIWLRLGFQIIPRICLTPLHALSIRCRRWL